MEIKFQVFLHLPVSVPIWYNVYSLLWNNLHWECFCCLCIVLDPVDPSITINTK